MKKIISIFFSLLMIMSMSLTAFGAPELQSPIDDDVSVCYSYTDSASSSLSISSKNATSKSVVIGISGTTTKIIVTQTLQKKNGSSWEKVASWSKTFNSWYAIYTNSKSSLSSGTYRVKTSAKVYSGTSYETVTTYSTTVSC
jgi:hypothetical protein